MELPPEIQLQIDQFAESLKTMSPSERSKLINDICGRVNEASFDLLAEHKMQKSPMECLQIARTTLTQSNQPQVLN